MSMGDFCEDGLLNAVFKNTAFAAHAQVQVALCTGDPGEGAIANEVTGGTYTRQTVTAANWATVSGGSTNNSAEISFTLMPACTVTHCAILKDTLTTVLFGGPLTDAAPKACTVVDGDLTANLVSCGSHGFTTDTRVAFYVEPYGGTIPTGLTEGTIYYVLATGLTADKFAVSTTSGGSAVDITAVGNALVQKCLPKVVNAGDTVKFTATSLVITCR